MVNNFDGTEWVGGITDFLNNPSARAVFRQQVGMFLSSDHFRGLIWISKLSPAWDSRAILRC